MYGLFHRFKPFLFIKARERYTPPQLNASRNMDPIRAITMQSRWSYGSIDVLIPASLNNEDSREDTHSRMKSPNGKHHRCKKILLWGLGIPIILRSQRYQEGDID